MKLNRRTTAIAAVGLLGTTVLGGGIAAAATGAPSGTVLLVNGSAAAAVDQSGAAALASRLSGVVLLVESASLPPATASALDSLNPARVFVVGGEASITPATFDQIRAAADQATVERVGGATRFETAAKLAALAAAEPPVVGEGGATGPAGPAGSDGATGPTGDTGPAGAQGPAGAPGAKGDTGPAGIAGATGAQGAPGSKGDTGLAGAPGTPGAPGAKGDTGSAGAQGIPGDKGDKGDKGDVGPAGSGLSVYDGNTRLGALTSATPSAISYLDANGVLQLVSPSAAVTNLGFSEPGCKGTAYLTENFNWRVAGDFRVDSAVGSLPAGMYTRDAGYVSRFVASLWISGDHHMGGQDPIGYCNPQNAHMSTAAITAISPVQVR